MQTAPDPPQAPGHTPRRMLTVALAFEVGLGAFAVALALIFGLRPWLNLEWNRAIVFIAIIATLPMAGMLLVLTRSRQAWADRLRRLIDELVVPAFKGLRWWAIGLISLAAGIGEELLFRGLVQGGLTGLAGPGPALVASALLFGLAHALTPAYFFLTTLAGLYLGALYWLTGNLLLPLLVHFLYDWIALSWALARTRADGSA